MKSFLILAALAIPLPAQQVSVDLLGFTPDCTYPIASQDQAGVVSRCHDAIDIAVIVVSMTALPGPSPIYPDPATLVLVDAMDLWPQPMGPHYWRWQITLNPSWAPLSFVAQVVWVRPAYIWSVPEAYRFTWM